MEQAVKKDAKVFKLGANDGEKHSLHGGFDAWSHRFWEAEEVKNGVKFSLKSEDGDGGYPGTVLASTTYTITCNDADPIKRFDFRI
jgi:aldose 1-epimerase